MNASQIEKNVIALVENFNKEEFIYNLLQAYGISKTSITRLKKGDFNLSKVDGEVLYNSKMLFKESNRGKLIMTCGTSKTFKSSYVCKMKRKRETRKSYKGGIGKQTVKTSVCNCNIKTKI